jgi:hypothetical protein
MRQLIFGAAALAAAMLAAPVTTPARAEIEYPYCGYGRSGDGGCTLSTLEQCRAFIAGTGGRCERNPRYGQGAITAPTSARR